jgi:anti-sigma factor RsiW
VRCEDAQALLDPYLDGELDARHSQELEQHLETCRDCRAAHEARTALSQALRQDALRYGAPAKLRQLFTDSSGAGTHTRRVDRQGWWRMAAAALVAALLGAGTTYQAMITAQPAPALAAEAVANHVRSLLVADRAMDVASSSEHTVKPWFNGRLDYAPPVLDLAAAGFPLAGGRLDYMDGRPVAALLYRYGPHVINLFVWPAHPGDASGASPSFETRQGYHVSHWTGAGMTWWAVSDVNEAELAVFVNTVRAETMPASDTPPAAK